MDRRAPHLIVAAAVTAALALAGCGGGGDDSTSTAASTRSTTETGAVNTSQAPSGSQEGTETSTTASSKASFTLGSPADVPRSEGGDNSIQDFGSEASRADRAAAGRALAAYYEALTKGDTEEACALLSSATRQSVQQTLDQLGAQGNGANLPKTCPQILELTSNVGSGHSPQLRLSELLSLRQQDDRAFLIYRAGDGRVYAIGMADEDGAWKVGGVSASPLAT
jgi:hypothetical protein